VRADEQFAPNKPIFNALALCISTRSRCDPRSTVNIVPLRKAGNYYNDMPVATMTLRHLSTSLR
jgi:hypothetical protein